MPDEKNEEDEVLAPSPTRTWKKVSTQIDEEQWKRVKRCALEHDLEIREVIYQALEDYLTKQNL